MRPIQRCRRSFTMPIVPVENKNKNRYFSSPDVNKNVDSFHYPLPRFQKLLETCMVWCHFLCCSGFDETKPPTSCHKKPFGFSSDKRKHEWFRLRFGVVPFYIDDFLRVLHQVLGRLKKFKLRLSTWKSQFAMTEFKYFGDLVSTESIAFQHKYLYRIPPWPKPTSRDQLRAFLGFPFWRVLSLRCSSFSRRPER